MSIGGETQILASRITPPSETTTDQPVAEIKVDFNHGSKLIDDDKDPYCDDESHHSEQDLEPNQSLHDNDNMIASLMINLQEMVE
jgi:hypothetical protein